MAGGDNYTSFDTVYYFPAEACAAPPSPLERAAAYLPTGFTVRCSPACNGRFCCRKTYLEPIERTQDVSPVAGEPWPVWEPPRNRRGLPPRLS